MLLAVVLLYVGAVLAVNGIWLIGQARAAEDVERVPAHAAAAAGESADVPSSVGGRGAEPAPARAERSPLFLQNREVAVINIFTGFVGVVIALIFLVQGAVGNNLAAVRGGGLILLFAFTYLWVAFNQYLDAGGRAFGWYCLFVAITAVPAGVYTLQNANGNTALIWLGINWFLWAILWALFWALLALELPIARPTGWLTIFEGVGTAWALGFAVLIGVFSF
ncbi:AmiS/UreI family transporter [Pseudonocardia halophobica]|uniref:Transporter n=1 Tax=Pseudonocardia halophobica TaxID=29401 RepID=A0A9W6NUQ5_9PSEU|nr:AmiS/UreI family transporter [Pseudonocardia halophobica]GLL09582.1 transporter [Pseudonocardia halophobica]